MKKKDKIPDGHGEQYTIKKDAAILALLTAPNQTEAAKQAGIGEATLYRWLQLDDFQQALKEARRQAVGVAMGRLQQAATAAVDVLKDVAENEDSPASARVSAAKTILEMAMKAVELDDVIRRLDELEKAIEARKGDLN
jgi:septum formation inhibitor MinC